MNVAKLHEEMRKQARELAIEHFGTEHTEEHVNIILASMLMGSNMTLDMVLDRMNM